MPPIDYQEEIFKLYGDKLSVSGNEIKSAIQKITVVCSEGHSFVSSVKSLLAYKGCPQCAGIKREIWIGEREFSNTKHLSKEFNIPASVLHYRIRKLGMTPEQAVSQGLKKTSNDEKKFTWKSFKEFEKDTKTNFKDFVSLENWTENKIKQADDDNWSTPNIKRLKEMAKGGFLLEQMKAELQNSEATILKMLKELDLLEDYVLKNAEYLYELADEPKKTSISDKNMVSEAVEAITEQDIKRIINNHENKTVELKSTFSKCMKNQQPPDKIRASALRAISGFMNSLGGTLLIGVADDRSILGIEADGYQGDQDSYIRLIIDKVKQHMSSYATTLVDVEVVRIKDQNHVCAISVKKSGKPIYFKPNPSKEEQIFYRRGDRGTYKLEMEDAFVYIKDHF